MKVFCSLAVSSLVVILLAGCSGAPVTQMQPDVYGTSIAAQSQLQVSGMMLTGTAQAPIIHITETAAGLIVSQTQVSAQKTEVASLWTPTPTVTPSITPSPTPNVPATVTMANVIAFQTATNLETERKKVSNTFWAVIAPMFLLVVLLMLAFVGISWSREHRHKRYDSGVPGDKPLLQDIVTGEIIDMDANPNYSSGKNKPLVQQVTEQWMERRFGFRPELPHVTAERQDQVKERDQTIELRSRALRRLADSQSRQPQLPSPDGVSQLPMSDDEMDIPLPPWGDIVEWDGRSMPLGKGRKGLITAEAASPHILVSGKTGAGKTRYMLRTLVTASLARGEQVINLGYSDGGFGVFAGHANYHSLHLNFSKDIVPCLKAVYEELQSRKGVIGGASMDWEHWQGTPPRPFVRLVIDELGNMAEDIYVTEGLNTTKELWRWVAMIANEGRKVGIRFVAALQDPTAKSMDLRFRRNCTLVAFQQGDASQSSAFMGTTGAEGLPVGRFMTRIERMEVAVGGGFAPTDEEISAYLHSKQVQSLDKPKWLQVDTPRQESLPEPTPVLAVDVARKQADEEISIQDKIRDAWFDVLNRREWKGWNDIERAVYGVVRNGSFQNKIKAKVAELEGVSAVELREHVNRLAGEWTTTTGATTTQNSQNMPVLGANAA